MILFVNSLAAREFITRYDVHVPMFGKVGYADVTFIQNGDDYEINLVANTVGTAALLLRNRIEVFISKGKVVDGRYIPDSFVKIKETTKKTKHETYYFNHDKKEISVIEESTKLVNRLKFNPDTFKVTLKEVKESSRKEEVLDTYKNADALTAYLNAKANCDTPEGFYKLIAVGAHDEKNNIVVSRLEGSEKKSAKLKFSSTASHIYNLHVEPFDKSDSIVDVLVALDDDGLLKEAFMGEIFWIGKITANRVYHNITRN